MRGIGSLVSTLHAAGVRLGVVDGRLRVDAPAGLLTDADRAALREHREELLALLAAEAPHPPAPTSLVDLAAGLSAEERARLDAEAAAGDVLARLVVEALAEPPAPQAVEAAEDVAVTITRALGPDGPGWAVVWSRVLDEEVVFTRALAVEVPAAYAGLPRFERDELAVLAAQRPDVGHLRAILDAKRKMPGAHVVRDSGVAVTPARDVFPMSAPTTRRRPA